MNSNFAILQNRSKNIIDPFNLYNNNIYETYEDRRLPLLFIKIKKIYFRFLRKTKIIQDLPIDINYNLKWKNRVKHINNWI